MRTCVALTLFLVVSLSLFLSTPTVYGEEPPGKPDFHDGTWIKLNDVPFQVPVIQSPTAKSIFTIATMRQYQHIPSSAKAYEIVPLHTTQPVLTAWDHEKVAYYALLVAEEWKVGDQLNITIDNSGCSALWTAAFLNVAPSGPIVRWWTIRLVNPDPPVVQTPPTPPSIPSPSRLPRGT